jgi:hypothetical protein
MGQRKGCRDMSRKKLTEAEKFMAKLRKQQKHEQDLIEMDWKDIQRKRIPEPAYFHEVGDEVDYGAWKYTEILDVLDGGKIYKCYSCTMHNHYGKLVFGDKIHFEPWYRLGFIKENWPNSVEENNDIFFHYSQRDLSGLLSLMFSSYGIDLEPNYQRGNVWIETQKISLIDSIFKNIDIGKFTIIKREWGDNPNKPKTPFMYEMLDGKQRLTAIYEFYIGKFKYKGMYFYEMNIGDRNHFRYYPVSYAETQPLTNEQKYRYFLKLNTTGTPMNKEHLRKVRELWLKEQLKR